MNNRFRNNINKNRHCRIHVFHEIKVATEVQRLPLSPTLNTSPKIVQPANTLFAGFFTGSPGWVWTNDPPVNSRMLYRWATEEYRIRQLPILPGRLQPSTIGVWELNYCVRDENRWTPQLSPPENGKHVSHSVLRTHWKMLFAHFLVLYSLASTSCSPEHIRHYKSRIAKRQEVSGTLKTAQRFVA